MVITLILLGLLAAVMWKAIPTANAVAVPTEIAIYNEAPIPYKNNNKATAYPFTAITTLTPIPTDNAPAGDAAIRKITQIITHPTEIVIATDTQYPEATLVTEYNWEPTQTEAFPAYKIATATARAAVGEAATPTSAPASPIATIVDTNQNTLSESQIYNGGFEDGRGVGWQEFSQLGYPIVMDATELTIIPESGSWASWLGGDNDEISSITQDITIGCDRPILSYYLWLESTDLCGFDYAHVLINKQAQMSFDLCVVNSFGAWKKFTHDLTGFIDQIVILEFSAVTDSSMSSSMFVDSVSLDAPPEPLCEPSPELPAMVYMPFISK